MSPTMTATPCHDWMVSLEIRDLTGQVLLTFDAGFSCHAITTITIHQDPYDPNTQTLTISSGSWSTTIDGTDSQGEPLANGVYQVATASTNRLNGAQVDSHTEFSLVRSETEGVSHLKAAPNPVKHSDQAVYIHWDVAAQTDVELKVYTTNGDLVASLGIFSKTTKARWNLKTSTHRPVANGIYLITARPIDARKATVFKLAVSR